MNFPIKYSITVISFYQSDSDILGLIYHTIRIASFQLNGNFTTRQISLYIFLFKMYAEDEKLREPQSWQHLHLYFGYA